MKQILFMVALLAGMSTGYAQYDKTKLEELLTNNGTKTWMVKSANTLRTEKSFTFNKDMSAEIVKTTGKGLGEPQKAAWALSTGDNIRWFITVGSDKFELIVSYAKDGSQYLKLVQKAGVELNLYPAK